MTVDCLEPSTSFGRNWIGDIEAVDEEEDQEEEVAIALNLEPESMWDCARAIIELSF